MKWFTQTILLFLTVTVFSQTKSLSQVIELTSKADTVYFIADNSGCFNSYVLNVKMCKQKSGDRKLILRSKARNEEKIISARHYKAFIKNYAMAVNHFSTID